jgi:hypothetical protein
MADKQNQIGPTGFRNMPWRWFTAAAVVHTVHTVDYQPAALAALAAAAAWH